MSDTAQAAKTSFESIKWPLIVAALLIGHTSLMLVAMTLANADPPDLVEGSPYSNAPKIQQSETPAQP